MSANDVVSPLPLQPRLELRHITPELAEQWLAKNTNNRTPKRTKIEQYARDMREGRWLVTGEAIKFGTNGVLLDGQNRLLAIVRAGVTVRSFVAWDVLPQAQNVMDSGAARTAADGLTMAGLPDAKMTAAAARIAMAVEKSAVDGSALDRGTFTNSEVQNWVLDHVDIIEARGVLGRDHRLIPLPASVRLYCAYRLMSVDRDAAVEFFEQFGSGVGIAPGSAILALRRRLTGEYGSSRRITVQEQITAVFRAWNAWRAGRPLARVLGDNHHGHGIPEPK